jgi:site-specific recombinase XerD
VDENSLLVRRFLARHAIRLQLDAVIALALQLGLRRTEIFALDTASVHYDNAYVVVWRNGEAWGDRCRKVPLTDEARPAIYEWLEFRSLLGIRQDRPWVALQGCNSVGEPMKRAAFDKLLRTYAGDGWTLKRLRDTCAVSWLRRGLSTEHLRQLMGYRTMDDTLPYVRLTGGSLEQRMATLASRMNGGGGRSEARKGTHAGTPAVLIEDASLSVSTA